MIDASPHISIPATIWIMCSFIKASIIFSASGATLVGLQSAHCDKVSSVHLAMKWGYQQARDSAGFNSVRMELTLTPSVCAPAATASWGLFLKKRKVGTTAHEELAVIAGRYPPAIKHWVNSRDPSSVLVSD